MFMAKYTACAAPSAFGSSPDRGAKTLQLLWLVSFPGFLLIKRNLVNSMCQLEPFPLEVLDFSTSVQHRTGLHCYFIKHKSHRPPMTFTAGRSGFIEWIYTARSRYHRVRVRCSWRSIPLALPPQPSAAPPTGEPRRWR